MFNLACLYANGHGVERDLTKARELFTKAGEQGHEMAVKYLKQLDDVEREDAAWDPNAIVCSACGLPQTSTRSFNKFKCPCKSTRYCNTKCQKKHWKEHRTECKRLIAELKRTRTRKLAAADEESNKNVTDVNAEKEKVNQDDVEGEEKSGTKELKEKTDKEEEEGDECPICLENLPKDTTKFVRWTCCGNGMHIHCDKDLASMKMDGSCPLCRAKTPSSDEEVVKQLRPWVKKKKAWALAHMAQKYRKGEGVKQSCEMARRLIEQAAQQGDVSAMYDLGIIYHHGQGVEQSYEKAKEYYDQAAQLGNAGAQCNLGIMYATGQGVAKDETKAHALWTASAAQGYETAIENLKILEMEMKKNMTKNATKNTCTK
jgi:TPR repeat protein